MSAFHITLALESIQAKNRSERTPEALTQIVDHFASTYLLTADERVHVAAMAMAQAEQRGLLCVPTVPLSLATLAMELDQSANETAAQLAKERLEAEWRIKQQPRKAQAAPCGLFEQAQQQLF